LIALRDQWEDLGRSCSFAGGAVKSFAGREMMIVFFPVRLALIFRYG
jgi:hypothetical protein